MKSIIKLNKGDISNLISGMKLISVTGYDLGKRIGTGQIAHNKVEELIEQSESAFFFEDQEEFPVHTLVLFEKKQIDIENISERGMKYDLVLIPS